MLTIENRNMLKEIKQESGQVIIVLLLIMLGALTVGLAITQRSVTDVTTSTQNEQSSRAFSAAEAGLESIVNRGAGDGSPILIDESSFGNTARADAFVSNAIPRAKQALEYPPVGKETVAQFWLVPPENPNVDGATFATADYKAYKGKQVDVYFGNYQATDDITTSEVKAETPAVELNLIIKDFASNTFKSKRFFYDPVSGTVSLTGGPVTSTVRAPGNGFTPVCLTTASIPPPINTSNSVDTNPPRGQVAVDDRLNDRQFRCRVTIPPTPLGSSEEMILLRARILYSNTLQKIAVKPLGALSLPAQADIYTSIGQAGQSKKTIQYFVLRNVASPFFDFSVFSAGSINKN